MQTVPPHHFLLWRSAVFAIEDGRLSASHTEGRVIIAVASVGAGAQCRLLIADFIAGAVSVGKRHCCSVIVFLFRKGFLSDWRRRCAAERRHECARLGVERELRELRHFAQ